MQIKNYIISAKTAQWENNETDWNAKEKFYIVEDASTAKYNYRDSKSN